MPTADPYIGREILGQFRILERVGSGGMGAVYKAEQPSMDRLVAVKILHPKLAARKDLVSRFRREARAMSHLTHPNTVRVFLYGQLDDGSLYIVMEFLAGKNLAQYVRADGPLSFERALPVMIQACGALEEAHRQGIVHRDLKPENIFLCTQGGITDYAKVLDFGLAKVTEREMRPGSLILTQEGMVFGTPEFMSPEQAQGKTLDPRSDIYSLGVILYELLTGKLPFSARVPMEYISLHVNAVPIPLGDRAPSRKFPAGLQEVMDRALAKNPDDRYQTAAEFAAALKSVLPGGGPRGSMAAIPPPQGGSGGGGGGLSFSGPTPSAPVADAAPGRQTSPGLQPGAAPPPVQEVVASSTPVHTPALASAPSDGPTELGDGSGSIAESIHGSASVAVSYRKSPLPMIAVIVAGIVFVGAAVVFVLSQRPVEVEGATIGFGPHGTAPQPLPPVPPLPTHAIPPLPRAPDAGLTTVSGHADAGGTGTAPPRTLDAAVADASSRSPHPPREPPEAGAACPPFADASFKAFARACADRLTSTDRFTIAYNIDDRGRANLSFRGAVGDDFRRCVVGQVVTLHLPGLRGACRGRFRFP